MANWQEKQNKNSCWFNFVAFVSDRMDITNERYLYTSNSEKKTLCLLAGPVYKKTNNC